MTDQKTITLAQWCAYLPYGIECEVSQIAPNWKVKLVVSSVQSGFTISDMQRCYAKPLLRPINEANKKPIESICKSLGFIPEYNMFIINYNHNNTRLYIKHDIMPYDVVQALLAAHYDIFNLIPQGLALPIE